MMMLCDFLLKLLIFDCSENAAKDDVDLARPEYGFHFKALLCCLLLFF